MKLCRFIAALIGAAVLSGDQLTLKNGSVVEGSFLGGDARTIRFAVGSQVKTFQLNDVRSIGFGDAQSTTPAAEEKREDRTSLQDQFASPGIFTLATSTNIIVNTEESLIHQRPKRAIGLQWILRFTSASSLSSRKVHRVSL